MTEVVKVVLKKSLNEMNALSVESTANGAWSDDIS